MQFLEYTCYAGLGCGTSTRRWDHANGLALSKLKYYLDDDVYQMVWKEEDLVAQ